MARLPGVAELGATPQADPARPIATPDVSGFARGAAALSAGAQQVGKGIATVGTSLGDVAVDRERWDYAKAHSDFLAKKLELDADTKRDTNYGPDDTGLTLPQRYNERLSSIANESASLIGAGTMRDRFVATIKPDIMKGSEAAFNHARGLENNASIAYVGEQGDNFINQGIATTDEATRTQLIDTHNQLVDGLVAKGAVTPVQALGMKQTWARQYATADVLHRADSDPQGVVNELRAAPHSGDEITNRIIAVEGGGKNPASSATGVGQFVHTTWLDVLKRNRPDLAAGKSDQQLLALRADKNLAREMTGDLRAENEAYLTKQGLPATPGQQYLAHFLGPGAATAVLKADPNQPVADVLAKAVGPKQAAVMIAANPTVLQGQLAGSVARWADGKMGGASGGGSIYDVLRPDEREHLLSVAEQKLQKQTVEGRADFAQREANAVQEAFDTGAPAKPLALADFIGVYGAKDGPARYSAYDTQVQTGRAINAMGGMSVTDRQAVVESLRPQAGDPDYALKAKAYDVAQTAAQNIDASLRKDPAAFAVSKLPASRDAFAAFQQSANAPDADRAAAAQKYATTVLSEQQRLGVASDLVRIVPQGYADHITQVLQKAATADDPAARVGLIGQVQREAAMWGTYWPQVMRQLAPSTQPVVRAIAAGADTTAMTRLLSLGKDEKPAALLKEQSETKFGDLTKSLNEEMTPFLKTLVGRQKGRDFVGYYSLAEKLGALYVRDGQSASDAAHAAFQALIGNRYDFRDTFRVPKSAGVAADDVQAGAQAARALLPSFGAVPPVDDIPGRTDAAASDLALLARDGKWITAPDNSGLNLAYGDKFVRTSSGKPLLLTWSQLGDLAKSADTRGSGLMGGTVFTP